jgi:hypothetical protein
MIVLPQDLVLNHISGIRNASGGPKAESQIARREADAAEHAIADGDKLYPLSQVIYLRGRARRTCGARSTPSGPCLSDPASSPSLRRAI